LSQHVETQRQYDGALQRERGNRQRVVDIHTAELQQDIVRAERKNDRAWGKVCAQLQLQLGVLQTQIAQYEIRRVRQKIGRRKSKSF
jgi:hypothetical protein